MMKTRILVLAAGLAVALAGGSAWAAGDAAKGEKVFRKCKACHSLEAGKNKVGPSLAGVVGRTAGTVPGYRYSKSLIAAGKKGLTWDEATLLEYLEDPSEFLKKYLGDKKARAKMSLKLTKKDQRADVIAYLKSKAK